MHQMLKGVSHGGFRGCGTGFKLTKHVEKEECYTCPSLGLVGRPIVVEQANQNRNDDVGDAHNDRSPQKQRTTSEAVHGPNGARHADQLCHVQDTSENQLHVICLSHGFKQLENVSIFVEVDE